MQDRDYCDAVTEMETYDEEETIGFLSLAMADRLIALKVAEGHETFEAFFEELLRDHATVRAQRKT